MNRIRLLPETLSNQIAAGEVVERPASVVKELVENALDADSRSVTVEIQAGGRSLIRVTDDGIGMSKDDALLCLERHATSKIRTVDDLTAITTMGFRGEAIPSIASVSRMTMTTRERDSDSPEGTQIIVHGGRIVEVKSAGAPSGTCMEIRQLFFNIPARKKFLRSEETERSHIQHYLTLAALSMPEVGFTFRNDDRTVWQWPAFKSDGSEASRLAALRDRLRSLHGTELELLQVHYEGQLETRPSMDPDEAQPDPVKIRITGFIGAPGVSRTTREDQNLFVNRRPVENRGLNFAMIEGYHTALMKGRYPVCCLFLEIDAAEVDVNVHPSKREVKFRHEQEIRRHMANAVRRTLLKYHTRTEGGSPSAGLPNPAQKQGSLCIEVENTSGPGITTLELPNLLPPGPNKPISPWPEPKERRGPLAVTTQPPPFTSVSRPDAAITAPPLADVQRAALQSTSESTAATSTKPAQIPALPPTGAPLLDVPLKLIGVVGRLYVVFESDRGMVLMDQHAAHERILFEQMLNRVEDTNAPTQRLLLPETVELSSRDATFLKEQLPILSRLGVGLSEFGERTFLLDALPPFVKAQNARTFILDVLDSLKEAGKDVNTMRLGEHVVAKTVCRHAVKANDSLAEKELLNLLTDLRKCSMPYTCPHGRPTLLEMNYRELERKFGRTQ